MDYVRLFANPFTLHGVELASVLSPWALTTVGLKATNFGPPAEKAGYHPG